MGSAVGIAFERDRRHCNDGGIRHLFLERVISLLALRKAEPPAVIVHDNGDMARIVEGNSGAIEYGVVEILLRRCELPDQPREIMSIFVIAGLATVGGEVILVLPLQLRCGRQRRLVRLLVADQVTADRYQASASRRPERGEDVGRPRDPIAAGDDRSIDL